jgi:AcrR family transcriptional regulator
VTIAAGGRRAPSRRRRELLDLAARLFAERGYQATSMRDIAEAADIQAGSLYHHFASKEAMVAEIVRAFMDDMTTRYRAAVAEAASPREALRDLVRIGFGSLEDHRLPIAILQNEYAHLRRLPGLAFLRRAENELGDIWVDVLRAGVRGGDFRRDLDPRLAHRFVRDAVWTAVRWYRPGSRFTLGQIADAYVDMLFGGLTPRQDRDR